MKNFFSHLVKISSATGNRFQLGAIRFQFYKLVEITYYLVFYRVGLEYGLEFCERQRGVFSG